MGDFDFLGDESLSKTRVLKSKPKPLTPKQDKQANALAGCMMVVAALVVIGAIGSFFGAGPPGEAHAVVDARECITTMLNYPDTASFGWDKAVERFGKRGFAVTSTVQAKNGFGVPETKVWTVRLRYNDKNECEIIQAWFHQ